MRTSAQLTATEAARKDPEGFGPGSPPRRKKSSGHGASVPKLRKTGMPPLSVDSTEARLAWTSEALCRNIDPDELFVRGAAQRKAATICRHCPVMLECAADALDNRVEFGVWGGMTERQRRALLKQHPNVTSWADFFEAHRRRKSAG